VCVCACLRACVRERVAVLVHLVMKSPGSVGYLCLRSESMLQIYSYNGEISWKSDNLNFEMRLGFCC
jgi:hypothetical protein